MVMITTMMIVTMTAIMEIKTITKTMVAVFMTAIITIESHNRHALF